MTEKVLKYSRSAVGAYDGVAQTKYWDCGIATLQIIAQAAGINISEDDLLAKVNASITNPGDKVGINGTNHAGLLCPTANDLMPGAGYTSVWLSREPVSQAQIDALFKNVKRSIDAGRGVIVNFEAPPGRGPQGSRGSVSPPYPRWITTYHYTAAMGYAIDDDGSRHVWIADPAAFGGITGYWCRVEEIARLIVPHAYAFAADANIAIPPTPVPISVPAPLTRIDELWVEWNAIQFGDPEAIGVIVAGARAKDQRAVKVLAQLERANPAALQDYIGKQEAS
jgi:hypothetical protein